MKKYILTVIAIILFSNGIFAQTSLNVNVVFESEWDVSNMNILLNNGRETKIISPLFINNQITIVDKLYGDFGILTLNKTNNQGLQENNVFILKKHKSTINFSNKQLKQENTLSKPKTKNAISIFETSTAKKLIKELAPKQKQFDNLLNKISQLDKPDDSLDKLLKLISDTILNSELKFIQKNGNEYYCYWLFNERIKGLFGQKHASELIDIFNRSFPDKVKNSFEGRETLSILFDWNQLETFGYAPSFKSVDIKGDSISLQQFSGKYVFIDFWASWCGPCVASIPFLLSLRQKFPDSALQIISVSYDTNLKDAEKIITSFGMNWRHIVNDRQLINKYGNGPIPAFYLIDPNGKILFSRFQNTESQITDYLTAKIK